MLQAGSSPFQSNLAHTTSQERARAGVSSPATATHHLGASGGNWNTGMPGYSWSTSTPGASGPSNFTPGASLNDSLSQSRPQYQPGYLLSLAQSQTGQQGHQRYDESHLIPTRAKMNPTFPRNTSSDFGTESIFETTKHRQHERVDDEDGPPTASVNDLVNDVYMDPHRIKTQKYYSTPSRPSPAQNNTSSANPSAHHQTLYVVVFGYPPTRFSATVSHFQSIAEGGTTNVENSSEVENAFKLGYNHPWEAARAIRRNGEIVNGEGGRWMVGVKWADSMLAEQVLGSVAAMSFTNTQPVGSPEDSPQHAMDASPDPSFSQVQRLNNSEFASSSSIGTPIRLAPSMSAFKKVDTESAKKSTQAASVQPTFSGSPGKGMFGQVTDLIFGW